MVKMRPDSAGELAMLPDPLAGLKRRGGRQMEERKVGRGRARMDGKEVGKRERREKRTGREEGRREVGVPPAQR